MELTGNMMEMQLIPKEEILEELSKLREEVTVTMKWIHIGTIGVVIKATFKEGIDSEIHLSIMDRRINNLSDGCLGTMDWKNGNMTLGLSFLEDHKPWEEKDNQKNLLIFTTNCGSEIKILQREKDKRKFSKVILSFKQQGLIDSDSFYEESEEEIKNLKRFAGIKGHGHKRGKQFLSRMSKGSSRETSMRTLWHGG
ncbi:movement protein [Sesamum angolense]|uniref:Movement protein n=1 Tax=Sesamum angolense TaxID=2727404 RepID=A0AAE1W3V3_9LAMI|nr:movement protein [Sesamum angolense]